MSYRHNFLVLPMFSEDLLFRKTIFSQFTEFRAPDRIEGVLRIIFSYFSTKIYVRTPH